ncbi:glycosyltransferase [Pollutimonas bauzanensis]|uniref:Glycosyl transferase family 2 n=1 Tax=Pollutimonas bauzanensis TaxID=658167 RepID=A0A1M5W933_9BURK|nr:glycosyltransferase [Pollutimonas bauzanensis]SHH83948.1 Glycosyl transferase family 2 [Pollutimonas bauzanensis]
MIGVCIPVHNEEERMAPCLESVLAAAAHPALRGESVAIAVVLDCCDDSSLRIAGRYPVTVLECRARNVGIARALGAMHLLSAGARWLAFTDADTRVSRRWIQAQLSLKAHAVCGTVTVEDWHLYGPDAQLLREGFEAAYRDADGHRHVHGANLGVSAWAYRQAGGFPPLACSEDQALVDALLRANIQIAWSARPRVRTSARRDARASGGFGDYLAQLLAGRLLTL